MTTEDVATIEVLSSAGECLRGAPIRTDRLAIGRDGAADLVCPDDERMASDHVHVLRKGEVFELEDRGDPGGVWLRVRGPEGRVLAEGDQLWLGGQLLQVARAEGDWTLRHHGPDGRFRAAHVVPAEGIFIGREADLVLDASDAQLSRRHAQVVREGATLRFYDRGAHNGSFVRVAASEPLADGAEFRAGSSRFRLVVASAAEAEASTQPPDVQSGPDEGTDGRGSAGLPDEKTDALGSAGLPDETTEALGPRGAENRAEAAGEAEGGADALERPAGTAAEPDRPVEAVGLAARLKRLARGADPAGGSGAEPERAGTAPRGDDSRSQAPGADSLEPVVVVLEAGGETVRLDGVCGQTVLEIAQDATLERGRFLDWECGDGGCGVCVLAIAEGGDRLDPPDPATGEMKTIQITEQVAPDPNRYRLACLAKVRGPVRLRKMT